MFRALGVLCDESTPRSDIKAAFDDLASRLGSKTELTAAIRIIVHRMSMNTVSSDTFVHLLELILDDGSLQPCSFPLAQLTLPLLSSFPNLLKGNESKAMEVAGLLLDELVTESQASGAKIKKISPNLIQDREDEEDIVASDVLHELCDLACNLIQVCLTVTSDVREHEGMAGRMHRFSRCLESLFVDTRIPKLAEPCLLTW